MFKIKDIKFAEKGFFINLPQSAQRLDNVNKLINHFNIEGLERFEALTDEMVHYSCTKSHLEVFRKSLNEDLDLIFVAEDDFNIDENLYFPYNEERRFSTTIKMISEDLEKIQWDVLLFGCNPKSHLIPVTNNLAVVHKSTGAWAYLIKKRAYSFLLDNLNYKRDYLAIDDFLPKLNDHGFITLTTIPLTINHSVGFESTLQPRGPVNYDAWIRGNYNKFLYSNYKNSFFMNDTIEKDLTIVIAGHFVDDYFKYLRFLLKSLPSCLNKCKFLIHYDANPNFDTIEIVKLNAYFRDIKGDLNVTISYSFGGLISTIDQIIEKIKTPYYLFLEHDWVFLNNFDINFPNVIKAFDNHNFINAVWFSKDDNLIRGFDIETDVEGKVTPFEKEERVTEVNLITTCRWSNNPVIFRTSKMKEWYYNIIKNEYVGKTNQQCHNVEESMIPAYRKCITQNKWNDIRDNWGTFLYGNLGEGPYVAHTDASKRYQGSSKSQPEINGEKYMNENPLLENE